MTAPGSPSPPPGSSRPPRKGLVLALLGVWGAVLIVICATLLAGHFYTLPVPAPEDARLVAAAAAAREPGDAWSALHVLYAQCPCSARVARHLLNSQRPVGLEETLLVVGAQPDWEHAARASGFDFETATAEDLAERYGIQGAPLMLVMAPDQSIRYAGGYTDRKQGLHIRDLEIISELRGGSQFASIPLYGCAVSRDLQAALDPLRLKYQ